MDAFFHPWGTCLAGDVATLDCLKIVFLNVVSALFLFAGTTALFMFVLGGYKFINAAGDPEKFKSAKHNFTYGLLGLVVIIFSYTIIRIIYIVTGVECITKFGFVCL